MASRSTCELCNEQGEIQMRAGADAYDCSCPACGSYAVSGHWRAAKMKTHLGEEKLVRLRGVVREDTDEHGSCREVIATDTYERIAARSRAPATPLEQLDQLLLFVARCSKVVGAEAQLGSY